MIVCICNNISNKDVLKELSINKNSNFESIITNLNCCNNCEICKFDIQDIIYSEGNKNNE